MPVGRLGGDQCVAAGAQSAVMSDKTCAASALGDLVNGGSHRVLSVSEGIDGCHSRSSRASGIAVCFLRGVRKNFTLKTCQQFLRLFDASTRWRAEVRYARPRRRCT
ncbi:hypothetical protein APV28_2976 [Comamonas testosteroni]|nr:hypothetical protein APV28_2976 [Comamonas testosteroni]